MSLRLTDRLSGGSAERRVALRRILLAAGLLVLVVAGFAVRGSGAERVSEAAVAPGMVDAAGVADDMAAPDDQAASVPAEPAVEEPVAASGGAEANAPAGSQAAVDREVVQPEVEPAPTDWASPREPSPFTASPERDRVRKPDAVRGIYIGAWSAGKRESLDRLIRLADETEINAFVIDVKDVTGEISYASRVPLAEQVGATGRIKIGNLRDVLERLKEHDIYPIARIVVFKDPLLAEARPDWSIRHKEDGGIWADNKGVHWVDSFNRDVWDYNIELAREAIALGFSEIQWDYIRFPDAPGSVLKNATYPARNGRTMVEGIREFMVYSRDRLADLDVPLTADVFGVTTSAGDIGIGQVWEQMADVMDVLLPMVYPSHYPRGTWGYPNPNAAPYQIVRKALGHGVNRNKAIEDAAGIRPWLQAFTMGDPDYGPRHIRAQIDAVYDAGLTEWILWHPGVRYPAEAFVTADGIKPWFAGWGEALYDGPLPGESAEDRDRRRGDRRRGPVGRPVGGR